MTSHTIAVGKEAWSVTLPANTLTLERAREFGPSISDPRKAIQQALERPYKLNFPLRKAFTPDDQVAVVIDESLPHLGALLAGLLAYLGAAGIPPQAITILSPAGESTSTWIDDLPDRYADVNTEVHQPDNQQRLSYLASTKEGRRVYLNRTLVQTDQIVILSGEGYDPLLGYRGAERCIYPTLADTEIRRACLRCFSLDAPGNETWPLMREARETTWLLGNPLVIQVIEGQGEEIQSVVAGMLDSTEEGIRLHNELWHVRVPQRADLVLATIEGDPSRHSFATFAQAVSNASRVLTPSGTLVLLSAANPLITSGIELLRTAEDLDAARSRVLDTKPEEYPALMQWLDAIEHSHLYVGCSWNAQLTEELQAIPLRTAEELQRLIDQCRGSCLYLPDAHKSWVEVKG